MRRLRLERLARCRSSCLTLIQSCRMLRMSKPCPIATSRCNTLAQICAVSLSSIPGRETNSGSETSRSLAFTARQHLAKINCTRSSVPFPRKTVFSHPSRFQFWQGQENPSNLPNELLSLVHLRTLATQNDPFSCGFSSLSHCYFSCICRGKTPSVLSLHCFTALHAFMKIYNGVCDQTVKNLGS